MNFQFYLEKLFASKDFQEFMKENPDASPCSGFFVIDLEGKTNQQHLDYYVPSTNKMFSFKLEGTCEKVPVEMIENRVPEKIAMNYNFDFKDIEKMILQKMLEEKVNNKIQKILLSLQHLNGKDYLVGTIFISTLGMIKVHIDISEKSITLFEKKNFMDMIKIVKK